MEPASPTLLAPMPNDAAGHTVIHVPLGPSEWALVAVPQPGGPHPPQPSVTGPFISPQPGDFTLALLPDRPADPGLGLAGVHYCRGHTLTYCPAAMITDLAARSLTALGDQAIVTALTSQPRGHDAHREPRIIITPAAHDLLTAGRDLHPAVTRRAGRDVTISVCSNLIDRVLAAILTSLWTAHARHLFHLSRPSAQSGLPAADVVSAQLLLAAGAGFTGPGRPDPIQVPRQRHPAALPARAAAGEWWPEQARPRRRRGRVHGARTVQPGDRDAAPAIPSEPTQPMSPAS